MKKGILAAAVAVALAGFGVSAKAATVASLIATDGTYRATDSDREFVINRVGSNPQVIDVGDSLRGIFYMDKLEFTDLANNTSLTHLGAPSTNDEWTGVFQVMVTSKVAVSPGVFNFTFGPDPTFAEAAAVGTAGKAMLVMYDDAVQNVNLNGGTIASRTATATDGTYFWSAGFTGAPVAGAATPGAGQGWIATGGDDVSAVINSGAILGSANFGITRVKGSTVGAGDANPLVPLTSPFFGYGSTFVGSSTIQGRGFVNTPFDLTSLTSFTFAVPVPAAVWSGLGLLGILAASRVRRLAQRD